LTTNNTQLDASASPRRVYLIDSGVAFHDDLNVVYRTNVACGTGVQNCSTGGPTDLYPVVGCYPHATHVAGIVGARGGNSKTSIGVYPGVKIISVSVTKSLSYPGECADSGPTNGTISTVGYALDWIYKDTLIRGSLGDSRVPIVNMSINPGGVGFRPTGQAETNRAALMRLVTPAYVFCGPANYWTSKVCVSQNYSGAFFVQSAGNIGDSSGNATYNANGKNLCAEYTYGSAVNQASLAYKPAANSTSASTSDGIVVVGAFHAHGRAASPADQFEGIRDGFGQRLQASTRYSNFGPCVDLWAPGNLIYSTYGKSYNSFLGDPRQSVVGVTYSGNGNTSTSGWTYLSGTSMAAPHVAGAAAYLADALNLTSPAAIETAVRARMFPTGALDTSSTAIMFTQVLNYLQEWERVRAAHSLVSLQKEGDYVQTALDTTEFDFVGIVCERVDVFAAVARRVLSEFNNDVAARTARTAASAPRRPAIGELGRWCPSVAPS
jgi:subtilisin family serine protease